MMDDLFPPRIDNEMILASAGSGKTWRLTNRYIRLLTLGVPPERILALTFTRKAASEFLDEILKKLARSARDEAYCREQVGIEGLTPEIAVQLLRQVVDKMHLLTLGTLDSFFNRVLRCFPAEFGLASGFNILQEHEAAATRLDVFDDLFSAGDLQEDFTEAFKLASFGVEEKRLVSLLEEFVKSFHGKFLAAPARTQWADEKTIWPDGCDWLTPVRNIDAICSELETAFDEVHTGNKNINKQWDKLAEVARTTTPGGKTGDLSALTKDLASNIGSLRAGTPITLTGYRKQYDLTPDVSRLAGQILTHLVFCEYFPHLQRTRGIYEVLRAYEDRYHQLVRRAGRLRFDDLQLLLCGLFDAEDSGLTLSQHGGGSLLNIDYRLDGRFDHWLLDEFQDTSLTQWRVIENLVDEVVQDTSGQRSFFYVGDVKQAIFGWRGGDSRLFYDIHDHYAAGETPGIQKDTLAASWRSGPVLMNAVNTIFGQRNVFEDLFPDHPEFVERWFATWENHASNHPQRNDFVQLLTTPKPENDGPQFKEMAFQATVRLLNEIRPHEKEMDCAVLVRKNSTARELADYIRAQSEVPVMVEGDTMIGSDHPVASSFLSLLQLAAHPGDRLAWGHLRMTPALAGLESSALENERRLLITGMLSAIHDSGFTAAFEQWLERLREGGFEPDEFAKNRIEQLRQATREYDRTGDRNIGYFSRYARAASARETPASGVVQIMTVHKSKGLGFDAVIVAETDRSAMESLTGLGRLPLLTRQGGEGLARRTKWVLSKPKNDYCDLDPALREARKILENDRAFEELCVLYVALTRAKFGTYLICPPAGNTTPASRILTETLSQAESETVAIGDFEFELSFESGDADWHSSPAFRTRPPEARVSDVETVTTRRRFAPLQRRMPSEKAEEAAGKRKQMFLFTPDSIRTARHGTLVHELFEQIEWLNGEPPEDMLAPHIDPDDSLETEALAEVLGSLRSPEIAALFDRATFGDGAKVWREKRFELADGETWLSGTFDRVVLTCEGRGRIKGARVLDFKTNRVESDEDIASACQDYAPQLASYRQALTKILGIPESRITCGLIFTKPAVYREVLPG